MDGHIESDSHRESTSLLPHSPLNPWPLSYNKKHTNCYKHTIIWSKIYELSIHIAVWSEIDNKSAKLASGNERDTNRMVCFCYWGKEIGIRQMLLNRYTGGHFRFLGQTFLLSKASNGAYLSHKSLQQLDSFQRLEMTIYIIRFQRSHIVWIEVHWSMILIS